MANHASRRAGASVDAGRQHAGVVLMPMRRERILPGPPIGLPVSRPVSAEVACARALHQPGHAARHHLIVVVVLPEVAERIDGELVSVAKVVRHDCQARPVGLHPQSQPARPDPPIVAHQSALVLQVVRSAAGIETPRADRFPGTIGHDMRAGVAGVEIPASVRSRDERVQAVIVIVATEAGQQDLFLVGFVVAVLVRIDDEVRRGRDDDAIADHCQPERCPQVFVLDEHLRLVGAAVAVGVGQDEDPIAGVMGQRALLCGIEVPVVDRFGDPDATADIDVDVGRVEEHR